jgi:MoaA/NifB/PqqE/SkfB family radical SAM enzyme
MKTRFGPDGLHFFDRLTGLNILLDEVRADQSTWSLAPRQVSIAITNLCDLHCVYCYAPKHRAMLSARSVATWLEELDQAGCMGVGFGGGEPTLHPHFADICRHAAEETQLAVTFTTHGHGLVSPLLERIAGKIHFIRVSVDGVEETYETQRGKQFSVLLKRLQNARELAPLGINVVVNKNTIRELDALADVAHDVNASELLLLPQQATNSVGAASGAICHELEHWVRSYTGKVRLTVSEAGSEGLPTCDPLPNEKGMRAYAHIDASGVIKASSYEKLGASIDADGVLAAMNRLKTMIGSDT